MKYSDFLIAEEGLLFTDKREERLDLLKQRKCLIVVTTSRDTSGGIHTKKYEKEYNFSGTSRVYLRQEEDMHSDDTSLFNLINPVYEKDKNAYKSEKFLSLLDKYSKQTNKLVVVIYDYAGIYKEQVVQSRPTIVVNSSAIATGIKEMIGEGHKLKDIKKKYEEHSYLKTDIPKNLFIKNPESLTLYHVSLKQDIKELTPKVTNKPMDKENFGIARISVAPTIDGCFRGVGNAATTSRYYIYKLLLTKDSKVVKPTTKLVPDRDHSDEYWVLTPTKVKSIGYIDVTVNKDGSKSFDDHVKE